MVCVRVCGVCVWCVCLWCVCVCDVPMGVDGKKIRFVILVREWRKDINVRG